jgi:hypothetical protein
MKTFKYSLISKLVYRYGNIPVTIILVTYVTVLFPEIFSHWYYIFFAVINLFLIVALNKYFIMTYKIFPFKISADNQRILCSDFFLSNKTTEIQFQNIDWIKGGIFSGYPTQPIYLHDSTQNKRIGIYVNTNELKQLLQIILQNINGNLYKDLLEKIRKG